MTFHVCESTISSVRNVTPRIAIGGGGGMHTMRSTVRTGIINKYKIRLRCAGECICTRACAHHHVGANKLQRQFIFWEVNQANRNLFCLRVAFTFATTTPNRLSTGHRHFCTADAPDKRWTHPKTNVVFIKMPYAFEGIYFKVWNASAFGVNIGCFSV